MIVELYKIFGVALLTLFAYVILKPIKPELSIFLTIIGVSLILFFCVDGIFSIIKTMTHFVEKTGIDVQLFSCLLKIIGVGYLTEFASNLCSTAGNASLADAVALAGKIAILIVGLPILSNLLNLIIEILP